MELLLPQMEGVKNLSDWPCQGTLSFHDKAGRGCTADAYRKTNVSKVPALGERTNQGVPFSVKRLSIQPDFKCRMFTEVKASGTT